MFLDQFIDQPPDQLEEGIGLALSGGGYRAMTLSLIRLNEVALLRKIKRISSVSGGSITAGILDSSWGASRSPAKLRRTSESWSNA